MSLNNVNITYAASGLGSPAVGEDFISGMIFYSAGYPSGFNAGHRIFPILSVADAEALGIVTNLSPTELDYMHYHIAEYFRANPTGSLFVMVTTDVALTSPSTNSYGEIVTLQNYANGKIRQIGIFERTIAFSEPNLTLIQAKVTASTTDNKPLEVIYQANFAGVTLSGLADLNSSFAKNVTVCIGQDGAGDGAALYTALGKSVGCAGLMLGAVSSALVSTSVAWVDKFQMATTEMDTLAFVEGTLYSALSTNAIELLNSKHYVFLRKFVGISGSYFNNDYTAVTATSDYHTIHLNRTIHKVAREVRARLLPSVSSPIYINADGTISLLSISFFKSECETALSYMVTSSELSQYKVIINAAQNVLSTGMLNINVQVIPVGVADFIDVQVGFVLSI